MTTQTAVIKQEKIQMSIMDLQGFDFMQRVANMFMHSGLVPQQYKQNLADCVIALNMAKQMEADPLTVMQNLHIIKGRPSWSTQFLISCFNKCGRFSSIQYHFSGKRGEDNWGCHASTKELSTGEILTGPEITIDIAKKEEWYAKNGSKWKTMPELMLRYRAASWLIRTVAPDISMGFYTADEVNDGLDRYDSEAEVSRHSVHDINMSNLYTDGDDNGHTPKSTLDKIVDNAQAKKPPATEAKQNITQNAPTEHLSVSAGATEQAIEEPSELFPS
jgi:hypothetical protein